MNQQKQISLAAVVPAAGVGKRMGAGCPKQYLRLGDRTVLEHTLQKLLDYPAIEQVVVVLHPEDEQFNLLPLSRHARLTAVTGGAERADSVLAGLLAVEQEWVMVHDAARPAITHGDLDKLLKAASRHDDGAILAMPVKDTMKRADVHGMIEATVDRERLWHALTPQLFPTLALRQAITGALAAGVAVTDEASAMEWCGYRPRLVEGRSDNIKLTRPEDLELMAWYLANQAHSEQYQQELR